MHSPEELALELAADLLELPADERSAAIERACGNDHQLQNAVRALLDEYDAMPRAFLGGQDRAHAPAPTPVRIGRFRIIREIGQGGMGVVYEAEQDAPKRRVALKVIRPGCVLPQHAARFRRESEILARLQHPGVAQIFEAGTHATPSGEQPYFAMELVEGLPLDQHARRHALGVRQRLDLMARVCDAVDAAHRRGIIHRDLKPANIVVVAAGGGGDPCGQPKVLDFGIARLTDNPGETVRTEPGQLIGTLTYMSPEQIGGPSQELDARSDVYALGVVLYELLAGTPPHDLTGRSIPDAAGAIRDKDPSRLGYLDPALRGDIETIVGKALEKDPARRYASAGALADDLRRFLADQPIIARAPSGAYQVRKFVRRNKVLVGGLLATAASLVAGTGAATYFAVSASRHAAEALRRESIASGALYRARLAAAQSASRAGDAATARSSLEQTSPSQGGWEYEVVLAGLDQSLATVPLPAAGRRAAIGFDPAGGLIRTCQVASASGLSGGSYRMLDLQEQSRWDLPGRFRSASFSSDRRTLVAVVDGPTPGVLLADASSGALEHQFPCADMPAQFNLNAVPDDRRAIPERVLPRAVQLQGACFTSPDGAALLRMSGAAVELWASPGAPPIRLEHPEGAAGAAFSPDGRLLATAGRDRAIRLFDLHHLPDPVWTIHGAHDDAIVSIAFDNQAARLVTGSQDRSVRLWDAHSRRLLARLVGHDRPVTAVAFTPDGTKIVSSDDNVLKLWDPSAVGDASVLTGPTRRVGALAVSPDGSILACGAKDIRLWDTLSREQIASIQLPPARGVVASLAFAADGRTLLAARSAGDRSDCWSIDLLSGEVSPAQDAALPPPGDVFEPRAGGDRFVRIAGSGSATSLMRGERLLKEWPNLQSRAAAFSPDGTILAIADADIDLFDAHTLRPIGRLRGHAAPVYALAFRPGGDQLVSGSDDRTVRIWDLGAQAELLELRGHLDRVEALAFTPDGSTLFSGAGDMTVRAWSTRSVADMLASRSLRRDTIDRERPRLLELMGEPGDARAAYARWSADHPRDARTAQIAREIILQISLDRSAPGPASPDQ